MAVPYFEQFLYPFLLSLKDGEQKKDEVKDNIVNYLNLTKEDLQIRTRKGTTTQVLDRIGWALQYLRRAKFVEIPQRATYRLTERGKDYLDNHKSLKIKDLMEYPEFVNFQNSKNKIKDTASNTFEQEEITPTEQLEQAYERIENDLVIELLTKVLEQSPEFFEYLVVDLLVKMGYGGSFANSAMVTRFVHDDGIDGIIYEDKLGLDKIYIQAKRYKRENTIGKPQIQQFSGALDEKKSTKGVFITTSSYSNEAKNYVKQLSKKIVLIDGLELARYMIEYNVGVSTRQIYEIKKIDLDYFEE
ncbi:MAG: restriction endonuclease [Bacteroidales bacterium]|nr:restriction endonuclease [Bacteroidales bacterium]